MHSSDTSKRGVRSGFDSVKQLFRGKSTNRSSNSKSKPQSRSSSSGSEHGHSSQEQREEPLKPLKPASQARGTRGLHATAYGSPDHFAQRDRLNNPTISIQVNDAQVFVRFFNCENLNVGRESLAAPNLKSLSSAAVAFLGECQVNDTPPTLLPPIPNPAYRGLALASSHGGYHLHFPDHAGARPFHSDTAADWNEIKAIHAQHFPNNVLLIGVGLGEPGPQCC
ncbi:hypothetical protein GGR58DRAFT_501555 [Xylaria digitata]|nr:hypothetical protein GGR58DRAFT_501555 [Xylaria digitata]